MGWRSEAACLGAPITVFYPPAVRGHINPADLDDARALCGGCGVAAECLADALEIEQAEYPGRVPFGFRGGMTARERRDLIVGTQEPPPPSRSGGGSGTGSPVCSPGAR